MSRSISSVSKRVSMLLIAGLLLSVPDLAGALSAGGGPGVPPAGAPPRDLGASEGASGARFDGALSTVINFPFSGGSDDRLRVVLPERCLVLNATLQLDGSSALPPAQNRLCTFADTQSNRAWDGVSEDSPPTGGPGNFLANQFDASCYSDVSRQDGNFYETMTWGFGSPYHLFKFKVTEDVVMSLSVKYVGLGYDYLFYSTDLQLYIYSSGHWTNIGGHSAFGVESDMVTIKKTISSPAGCIDSNGMVNILAMGPDGWIFSFLDTDYVELTVKGSDYAWPSNLSLDLGADGFAELESPGELKGSTLVGSGLLTEPLQAFVDAIGEAGGTVEVPFRFSSATGGVLTVRGTVDIDLPPVFSPIPPEKLCFDEDTAAYSFVELDSYCRDDRDLRPSYEVFMRPPDGKIECAVNASGHRLDLWPTVANWSGTREFGLRATDSSGLAAVTFFNATVRPVNDPPVIFQVADQTAYEDQPFTLVLRAYDVDDPPANLTFSDDFLLSEIGATSGVFSFTPTNDQVGRYPVNVSVQDPMGALASIFFFLTVENVNDAPVLVCDEELLATEDRPFEYEPDGFDIDRGDNLTFSLESDIFGLEADPETGLIEFTFENGHVGEHELMLSLTDSAGARDSRELLLTVENVNDAPVIEPGCELFAVEDEEFEYRVNATDVDKGDILAYSIDSNFLEIDELDGIIGFTPGDEHVGRHKFTVTVTDRSGVSTQARYVLVVENVNDAPSQLAIVSPRANAELRQGEPVLLSATAFDPDIGDVLVFTWKEGERVLGRGANLSATLRPGAHLLTLEVSDGTVNETVDVRFAVLKAETGAGGILGILSIAALPLGLLLAAIVAVALVTHQRRKNEEASKQRFAPPPGPPFQPLPYPPGPQQPPAGMYRPPFPPAGQQPGYPPVAQQPPAGPYQPQMYPPGYNINAGQPQPPGYYQYQHQSFPSGPYPSPPAQPFQEPPYMARPHPQTPFDQPPANLTQAPHRPTVTAPQVASGAGNANQARNGPPAATAADAEPPFAIPLNERAPAASTGAARPAALPPNEPTRRHDEPDDEETDEEEEEHAPRPGTGRRRGDESVVSREAMRGAINDARHAISAARAAGLNPSDCDRLLSESMAASYRLDYVRARNLSRRAESAALSLLERAAREEERDGEAALAADEDGLDEDAEEAA